MSDLKLWQNPNFGVHTRYGYAQNEINRQSQRIKELEADLKRVERENHKTIFDLTEKVIPNLRDQLAEAQRMVNGYMAAEQNYNDEI